MLLIEIDYKIGIVMDIKTSFAFKATLFTIENSNKLSCYFTSKKSAISHIYNNQEEIFMTDNSPWYDVIN